MLGRQLVGFRTAGGRIVVMDAQCSHLGADLGCGRITGESIQCPFHNWQYGLDGRCTHIPHTTKIPSFARQTVYPAVERHGYVFFFNGRQPLFPLPFFFDADPDDCSAGKPFRYVADCTWYMNTAHGFDTQHFEAVHERKLVAPPMVDCPSLFARRNRYRAEVVGQTVFDRLLRIFAGRMVDITITVWGGTFVLITADFDRIHSGFLMATLPLDETHTLCEGIVFTRRSRNRLVRRLVTPLSLWVRRLFTHGYLADEARRLRGTQYKPTSFIDHDQDMVDFFQWLVALPQQPQRGGESTVPLMSEERPVAVCSTQNQA
jgi:nitrite reductase/ring-hydroxylating ferredoxin subunit